MTNSKRFYNTSRATLISEAKRNQRRAAQCHAEFARSGSTYAGLEASIFSQLARQCLYAVIAPSATFIEEC